MNYNDSDFDIRHSIQVSIRQHVYIILNLYRPTYSYGKWVNFRQNMNFEDIKTGITVTRTDSSLREVNYMQIVLGHTVLYFSFLTGRVRSLCINLRKCKEYRPVSPLFTLKCGLDLFKAFASSGRHITALLTRNFY